MRFRVLGPVEVHTGEGQVLTQPRRQERCLLAILLLEAGRVVSVDRLCELLWDDNPPQQPHRVLRSQIARIRALLAQAGAAEHGVSLASQQRGYLLKVDPDTVDVHQFRRLLQAAEHTSDPADRDRLLREALALWHGPALQHAATDRLRQRLCADLDEQRLHAVEESIAIGLDLGRHDQLLPELARLGAEYPVRERLVELHMRALYRQGRIAEALQVYRHVRARLADELGLDTGPALQHLHQAILRGDPLPATQSPAPGRSTGHTTPAQLPADLTTFTGRAEHLKQLDDLLDTNSTAVVISAIAGTAGIGKTTLAVHWAHRVRDRFPDGQLYANLRGFDPAAEPTQPAQVIRGFLDALQVAPQRIPTDIDAQIGLYRSLLADRRVLVMLDNARDADQVRPLLPTAPGCLALVTSRNWLTGLVAVDGAQPLTLDLLSNEEARQLLTARLGTGRVATEPDAVDELIELCDRLPLALAVAAARAATQPDLPLAAIVAELRATRGALDALTGDDTATDIRAVFACSYHALSPEAARLFRLLGLHLGPDTSAAAAASLAAIPPDQARRLLAELTRAHLVGQPTPGRYTFHDLLRAYATEQTHTHDTDTERHAALHRLLDHYLHTAYTADRLLNPHRDYRDPITLDPAEAGVTPEDLTDAPQALGWFTAEHRVLLATIDQAASTGFDNHTWQLAWTLANMLNVRGHWHDWAATQQIALDAAQRLANRPGQAASHHLLGRAHTWLGRHDQAQTHLRHALDLYGEVADQTGQARTHVDLSLLFLQQGRLPQALDHAQQAVDLYQATGHRTGEAGALSAVGWCRTHLGDHRQALIDCQRALALLEGLDDRRGESWAWKTLGYAHHHLGHHDQAVTHNQHALDLFRDLGDRYHEADTLTLLGDTHHATGDTDAARTAWQHALDILTDLHHPDADAVRTKLHNIDHPGLQPVTPTTT